MTRFARAKGSKSSNERVAEDATSWNEFKRQLEKGKTDDSTNTSDIGAQDTLKRFKQPRPCESTDWADFGPPQVLTEPSKTIPNKKRKVRDTHEDGEEVVKERKIKKLKDDAKSSMSGMSEEVEAASNVKKKKLKQNEKKEEINGFNYSKFDNNCEMSHDLNSKPKSKKQQKANKGKDQSSSPPKMLDLATDNGAGQFKRRKPYIESSTISINGITINVSKFDGFDVKSEDAIRLKELKSKMLKEGIPRLEVDKAMKLERRRAEKALAREKKKVCFNCRKAGHLLSECPEVGTFSSKSFDSSAVNLCYKCGSTEHTHYQCQVKKKKEYSFATCFICKEQGHISSQCPDNPRGLYPQGGCCKNCGEVTHLKKDCPQLSKERSESTVTLETLDSCNKVESLGNGGEVPKKERKIVVKQRKIIKF